MSLRTRDTVLVHVTTFKGQHKIQSRWENREYVVEQQPYPNLPVYMVHPIDWEWHNHTLHQNFLLPISHNLGQDECGNSVEPQHPSQYFRFVGWPVNLPVHLVMAAHSFHEKNSVKTLFFNHHRSARHK